MIQSSSLRWGGSFILALLVTTALFFSMHAMIRHDGDGVVPNELYKVIDFVAPHKERLTPEIQKELPPEPKPKEQPPKVSTQATKSNKSSVTPLPLQTIAMPDISGIGNGAKLFGSAPKIPNGMQEMKFDAELTPMVQINPLQPKRAKRMGVEGHIKARLEVDESGSVTNIQIVESIPKGTFDMAAIRALNKWKFRPKMVANKAVAQVGIVTLSFKLGEKR
ncbi:MAG: energy transducer TonB [Sulfurimonas sp.]